MVLGKRFSRQWGDLHDECIQSRLQDLVFCNIKVVMEGRQKLVVRDLPAYSFSRDPDFSNVDLIGWRRRLLRAMRC